MDRRKSIIAMAIAAVIAVAAVVLIVNPHINDYDGNHVYYHGNGGTFEGKDVYQFSDTTVHENRFVYGDHTFTGFNTRADGTGAAFDAGDRVALGTHLYAQWKTAGFEITFPVNEYKDYLALSISGESIPATNIDEGGTFDVSPSFTLKLTVVRDGYTAVWYEDNVVDVYSADLFKAYMFDLSIASGQGSTKINTPVVSSDGKTATFLVTGVEKGHPVTVKYDTERADCIFYWGNGGLTSDGKSKLEIRGTDKVLSQNELFPQFPAGKSPLNRWNTESDGSGRNFTVGGTVPVGFYLYAQWE